MTDKTELKRLAQRVIDIEALDGEQPISAALDEFQAAATPEAVLALIAENERLSTSGLGVKMEVFEIVCDERDQLKAENEELRKDAERFKFLMKSEILGDDSPPRGLYVIFEDGRGFGDLLCGDEAIKEIDAAIAEQKVTKP